MATWVFHVAFGAGLLFFVALEATRPGFRDASLGRSQRVRRNWTFLVAALAAGLTVQKITSLLRGQLDPIAAWPRVPGVELVACFLVAELVGWVLHYVKHRVGFLWKFHFSHHRETRYDVWLTTHTHALEVVISGSMMGGILVLSGFSAVTVDAYLLFYSLANTYQHVSHDLTLGWLDKIIVNPAYHRLHHAVGSHSNFGNTLTIWDVVFRTASWPASHKAPDVEIGIGDGPEPYGFAAEMAYFAKAEAPALEPVREL